MESWRIGEKAWVSMNCKKKRDITLQESCSTKSSPFQGLGLFSSMYFLRRQNPNCLRAVLTSSSLSVLIKILPARNATLISLHTSSGTLRVSSFTYFILLLLQICSMTIWMLLVLLVDLSITVKTVLSSGMYASTSTPTIFVSFSFTVKSLSLE